MKDRFLNILYSEKLKIVFFLLALAYSFNFIFWGFDLTDTFYYINLFPQFRTTPTISGTLAVGLLWTKILGNSLISVRILAWICGIAALLLPYFTLTPRKLWFQKIHFLALSIILIGPFFINGFNPDIPTLLFVSISLLLVIKYAQVHKLNYLIFIAVVSSFSVFLKFPNASLFPLILLIIPLIEVFYNSPAHKTFWYQSLKGMLLFILAYVSVFFMVSMAFFGSVNAYFACLYAHLNDLTAVDESHSIKSVMQAVYSDVNKIILYAGVLFLLDYILYNYKEFVGKRLKIMMLIAGYGMFFFFMYAEIVGRYYYVSLKQLLSAIILYILIKVCIKNLKNNDYKRCVLNLFILAFAFVVPLGSNTGLLKFSSLLLCFMPFLLIESGLSLKKTKYLIPFIMIFVLFVVREYAHTYEDAKITKLSATVKLGNKLKAVRTSPIRAEFIEDVMSEYSALEDKKNMVFYGVVRHFFYYLTQTQALYPTSYGMRPENKSELENAQKQIIKSQAVFFILIQYPDAYDEHYGLTGIENLLVQNNYTLKKKKYYKIYFPENKAETYSTVK